MHLLEGRIDRGAVLHSAYAPTGIVGIGAVLVPWLLSGGTLHLHHFRDLDGLASEIATTSADIAVLPEGLVDAVAARLDAMDAALPSISAVWRATPPASAGPGAFSRRAAVDLIPIGEFALVASPRDRDTAAAIPIGPVIAPRGTPGGPVLVETRLVGRQQRAGNTDDTLLTGEIAVSGAMVPDIGWPGGRAPAIVTDDAGFVLTGATARPLDTDPPSAAIAGHGRERAVTGGVAVNLAELDHLLIEGTAHAAAAFAVPDPILGERLRAAIVTDDGDAFDPAALKAFLAERRTGLHKMPSAITAVAALPEHPDGTVDRAALKKSASG